MVRFVLPPGFRFHPTDEELLCHYLKRKVCGRKIDFEAIAEIDLYKYEPWDLPEKSLLNARDLEWYFFIPRDKKYTNGSRTNRATERGYWKSTGKDRFISSASRVVGSKKTLVYYSGRAPKGERTNWVIHEYRLNDSECERVHALQNGYVLCRLFHKSGAGPKNSEQYGAPVEDDDFESSPAVEDDRHGSFTANPFEAGGSMVNAHHAESPVSICVSAAVYDESNMMEPPSSNCDIQPHKLEVWDSASNTVSEVLEGKRVLPWANSFATGNSGHDNRIDFSALPSECYEEEKILRELYDLVSNPDEAESRDIFESAPRFLGMDSGGRHALPLREGDFLELADLLTVSDRENGWKVDASYLGHTTNCVDHDCEWEDSSVGDGFTNRKQDVSKGILEEAILLQSVQMELSLSPANLNSQDQSVRYNSLEDLLPPGGKANEEMDSFEPEYEDVLEFFDQVNASASGNKSFSLQGLAENMQRELLQADVFRTNNIDFSLEDGRYYYDALSLTDMLDMRVESINPKDHDTLVGNGNTLPALEDKIHMDSEGYPTHQESLVETTGMLGDGFFRPQAEGLTSSVEEGKHPASPLSLLWSCLDSLPTLPASAADLSPKGNSTSRGSLRMTFVGNGKENGEHKRDLKLHGKLSRNVSKGWNIGFWGLAVLGGVLGLLVARGAWKLLGGMYR